MNISKIGSATFKGYLTIQHKNEVYSFNTKDIKSINNSKKDGGVIIEGRGLITEGEDGPFYTNTKLLIPYNVISPNTIKAGYEFARQCEKAEVILKNAE